MSSKSDQIMALITAAIVLSESFKDDLARDGKFSDESILLLSGFRARHESLKELLAAVESSLVNGGPNGNH